MSTNLTAYESADRAGTSVDTIYRAIRRGELGAIRFGPRTIRVPEDELAAYIARKTVPAAAAPADRDGAA
ncbi:helix-turn-helix domain-containing protein [Isoptericola sp. 4D.3]|uniref:Helix-turn-helix domain-containing protein n=1 Tax=Isoptericola peretonis TaxID=2918523 RepID=A0ABT0J0S0_9MICO|nr:helix-turn-helix domain-containing protein [Isoptericola sp. 4D.3]